MAAASQRRSRGRRSPEREPRCRTTDGKGLMFPASGPGWKHGSTGPNSVRRPNNRFAMAKKKSRKTTAAKRSSPKSPRTVRAARNTEPRGDIRGASRLAPLTGLARDLYLQVLNKIAFQDYEDCCLVDALAEQLGKTPGRLQPAIRKLVEWGYVTLEGEIYPIICPTIEALRHQDPRLSEKDARKILDKVRRA